MRGAGGRGGGARSASGGERGDGARGVGVVEGRGGGRGEGVGVGIGERATVPERLIVRVAVLAWHGPCFSIWA